MNELSRNGGMGGPPRHLGDERRPERVSGQCGFRNLLPELVELMGIEPMTS